MYRGLILFVVCLFVTTQPIAAQSISQSAANNDLEEELKQNHIEVIDLNETALLAQFESKAPVVTLPFLSSSKSFRIKEFSIYGDEPSPYPDVKTYKIYSEDDPSLSGRVTTGPIGINISYLKDGKMVRIYNPQPGIARKDRQYVQEIGIAGEEKSLHACTQHEGFSVKPVEEEKLDGVHFGENLVKRNGAIKRRYRAAIMCTGEYYVANGNSNIAVRNLIIANLNDVSAIFEKDLAVEMYMATNSPRLQSDINGDPFDPSFGGRTGQAQSAIEDAFPISRYDVGHVFHNHSSGDGWATGGVAGLGVICNPGRKASGWSGSFNNTTNGWIQLAAHEFGHMYGAPHTFNGSGDANCTPNISASTSYEIGSGSTIMSYQGLCESEQNIPGSGIADNYFHVNSLDLMVSYLEAAGGCNTNEWILDNNNEPIADANSCGAELIIPRSTPFVLRGEATDADNDMLTYCWEQYDEDGGGTPSIGLIGTDAAFYNGSCPLFRSYPPTSDPDRYFPNLSDLSSNNVTDFEALPRRQRLIKFRLTVRDNNPEGGAIDWDEITVSSRNSGPLNVTAPTGGITVQAGSTIEVNWETNTRVQDEGICEKAEIRLSTDGGLSFPLVIAEDIDYEAGTAMVDIPASFANTDNARVMVACADYECFAFFDISNSDFSIESNCFAPSNLLCDTAEEVLDFGDPALDFDLETIQGTTITNLLGPIADDISTLPTMNPTVNNATGTCTRITSINNPFLETRFSVTQSGTYTFNLNNNIADLVTAYTVFSSNFNPADACSSFIESNAEFNGSYQYSTSFSVELQACTEYVLAAQMTNSSSENLAISSINGPGSVIRSQDVADYDLTYIAVENNSDIIIQHSVDADFRTLPVGEYMIYSAYYKARGAAPPADVNPDNWVGQTVSSLLGSLDCFRTSIEGKPVTVLQSCFIFDFELGNQTPCMPETNTYSQEISFGIDMGPGTGTVLINGQNFNVTGDQMNVTLTDLLANGDPVDLEFVFSDDNGCDGIYEEVFVSPANCCPIDIDLGEDMIYCAGDVITLDAGSEATEYVWFKDGEQLTESGQFLEVTENGNYRAVVTHTSGCMNEDDVNLSFEILPLITLDRTEVLACDGELVIVNAFVSIQNGTILWQRNGEDLPNMGTSIELTQSGTYELFVTTPNNCTSSISFEADFAESPEVDLGPDILTCTGSTTLLDAGEDGIEYVWRRNFFAIPGDQSTIEVTNFGVYTVEVTNGNGCTTSDTLELDTEDLPEFDFGRDVTRCDGNFYTIEAEPSAFEVAWYKDGELIPGETDIEYTPTESGVYVGQIFVNDQCIEGDTLEVEYLEVPNVDFPDVLSACPGEVINLVVDDLNAVFTWSSEADGILPETSNTLEVTESGVYYIEARSTITFCIVRDTVEVNFTDIPIIDLGDDVNACDGEEVIIGSPTEGFLAEWYLDGELIVGETDENLVVTTSGTYRMRISSGSACDTEDEITVSFTPSPVVDLGDDLSSCPGEIIVLDAGDMTNSFVWTRDGDVLAETSSMLEVSGTGLYAVTATNANDCSTEASITVTFADLPDLDLGTDQTRCEGDVYTIDADAEGFEVEWYFNDELLATNIGDQLEAPAIGEYVVLVIGGENCSVSDTININYLPFPDADLGDDMSACPGDVINLEVEDLGYDFIWGGLAQGQLATDVNSIEVTDSDSYYVEVSNIAGCTTRDTINISFIELPLLDLGPDQEICEGETVELNNNANGFDVEWSKDGEVINGESGESLVITESGTYSMTISANEDCSVSDEVTINVNEIPVVELGDDRAACPGDLIELNAGDPGNIFTWSSESGGSLAETSNILVVTTSDTYYVEVSNAGDCIVRDTITVEFSELPNLDLGPDQEICAGETFELFNMASGFNVEWQKDGETIMGENGESLVVTETGTYTMQIFANQDCFISDEVTINVNEIPIVDLGDDRAACPGDLVELNAGDPGNIFTWSSELGGSLAETSNVLVVTTSDTYYVEVSNAGDCIVRDTITVEFSELPMLDLGADREVCAGEIVELSNLASGFNIEWQKDGETIVGENGESLFVTETGVYTMQIFANQDCFVSDDVTVTVNDLPVVDLGEDRAGCPGDLIDLDAGDPGNTFIWSSESGGVLAETSNVLSVGNSDSYYVEVSNAAGCITRDSVTIEFTELPTIDLGADVDNLCEGDSFELNVDAGTFMIEWQRDGNTIMGETMQQLAITESGNYTVIVSANEDCSVEDEVSINFNALPAITDLSDLVACEGESVNLTAGTDGEYQFIWYDGMNAIIQDGPSASLEVTASDSYTVEAIDLNGCISSSSSEVTFIAAPTVELEESLEICEGATANISATSNVGVIEWYLDGQLITGETDVELEISEGGEYVAVVGSGTQCEDRDSITVAIISAPQIEYQGENQICSDLLPYTLTIATDANTQVQWFEDGNAIMGATSNSIEVMASGNYSVEVVNASNCRSEESITFEVVELSSNSLGTVPQLCEGESFEMMADTDGARFEWYQDGNIINGANELSLDINEAGEYSFISYNALDCPTESSFTVVIDELPLAELGADTQSACNGETIELENSSQGDSYVWSRDGMTINGKQIAA